MEEIAVEGAGKSAGEASAHDIKRTIRVGLLWHSAASGNLGVGALTLANIAIVRDAARAVGLVPEFVIMGMKERGRPYLPAEDAAVYSIDTRTLIAPHGLWAALGQVDCVLDIGAGDSFADIYGPRRFAFLWLSKMLTIARGAPLMLAPQTIGPFTKKGYRTLARLTLERAEVVVARDERSLNALKSLAPKAEARLAVDVAFALPYSDRSAQRGGRTIRVGLNVSGLLYNEAKEGLNRFGLSYNYCRVIRRFLAELSQQDGFEVHLITHATHVSDTWDDDGGVADELAAEFTAAKRIPDFTDPCEAKSYISGLDILIAGRMHACIAAFSTGVPVVPMAYSRKFTGLFGMLGYPHLTPVEGMNDDEATNFLRGAVERRSEFAADIERSRQKVDALLEVYRSELRRFLAAAAR